MSRPFLFLCDTSFLVLTLSLRIGQFSLISKTSYWFLVPGSQIFVLSITIARMVETLRTRCCIAGGGPAGMMLGFLLARMGVDVVVLEKHADFLRDFRGDTIHPSTLEIMYELGILDEFLKRPHQEVRHLAGQIGNETVAIADFTHLPTHCKFLGLMPQWDFLNFIAEQAGGIRRFI